MKYQYQITDISNEQSLGRGEPQKWRIMYRAEMEMLLFTPSPVLYC